MKKNVLCLSAFLTLLSFQAFSLGVTEPCDNASPSNIMVTGIGGTWVSLIWNSVQNSASYTVQTYHNNDLIYQTVTNDTFITVTGLLPNTSYHFVVSSNCKSGQMSSLNIDIDALTLILVDLLVENSNLNMGIKSCNEEFVHNTVSCEFNSVMLGEIKDNQTGKMIRFGVKPAEGSASNAKLWKVNPSSYQEFAFPNANLLTDQNQSFGLGCEYIKVFTRTENEIFGHLRIRASNMPNYYIIEFIPKYSFRPTSSQTFSFSLYFSGPELNDPSDREIKLNKQLPAPSILPNPTTTTLQIQIPTTFTTP
ncbi:MAG: fibronectin type III domain-containing protein, partial [Bacteroidota bacterium]